MKAAINESDSGDLRWFFGRGQTCFERSYFGAQCEALARLAAHTSCCPGCSLPGAHPDSVGSGFGKDHDLCRRCDGRGFVSRRVLKHQDTKLTARPTRPEPTCDREVAAEGDLVRYAHVSRVLSRLPQQVQRVLEAFYGDVGCYFAREHGSALLAVYLTTLTAEKLLARGRTGAEPDYVRLGRMIRSNSIQPVEQEAALLKAAGKQAERLMRAAVAEWNDVVDPKRPTESSSHARSVA
jgi:hypothetical protein